MLDSKKSIPTVATATVLTISLLMMYSTDVAAAASMSSCELQCTTSCQGTGDHLQACIRSCVHKSCTQRVFATLDAPYDPFRDQHIPCKMDCVSSKCMDSGYDAEKTADCARSCATECDKSKN